MDIPENVTEKTSLLKIEDEFLKIFKENKN